MDNNTYLFEISWEVCNKVGGIYTVIKSKTSHVNANFNKYFVVGPYFPDKHSSEFIEEQPPDIFSEVFDNLRKEGISCHYGKWLTDVEVDAILIDFSSFASKKNEIKTELWNNYQIDSLATSYHDFDEAVIWAYAAGIVIGKISSGKRVIAHCHEWLAGATILYLKNRNVNVATVFTTHATVLGRSLSGAGVDVYSNNLSFDLGKPEYRTSLLPKHQVEQQAAKNSDVCTTVSPITAIEVQKFLGRKADVLLLNGLNISKFPTFEEASVRHVLFKRKLKEFILYYFFPYYNFNIDDSLIYFLASRYEFHSKGIDIYIKALGQLNRQLKDNKSDKTIITFFWVPGNAKAVKADLAQSKTAFKDIKDSITDEHDTLMERLLTSVIASRSSCDETYLLGESLLSELRKKMLAFKRSGLPPLSSHDLHNEDSDEILNALKEANLLNRESDRVKVVLYPIYLTGADNLIDLTYYESMQGSHLGVFPSFYEPWGYTPVEAAALGVSSITTDLSGFGRYICNDARCKKSQGIYVMNRFGKDDSVVTKELTKALYKFAMFSVHQRNKNKIEAKRIASITDWKYMIKNYIKAYEMAIKKKGL